MTSTLNREGMERSSLTRIHSLHKIQTWGSHHSCVHGVDTAGVTRSYPMRVDMLQCGIVGVNLMEIVLVLLSITTPSGCMTFSSSSE